MILVVDASIAVKWFVREPGHESAVDLLDRAGQLHAPDLIVAEVGNVAWAKRRRGEIGDAQALAMLAALPGMLERLHPAAPFAERAMELATMLDHPFYDCLYLGLAESLGGTLATADQRFLRALRLGGFEALSLAP